MSSNIIGQKVLVIVDRPLGSHHPVYPSLIYPINYGYVEGVIGGDLEEQDAYVLGVKEPISYFEGIVKAIVIRKNDVETKWVVCHEDAYLSKEEILEMIEFQEKYFDIELVM